MDTKVSWKGSSCDVFRSGLNLIFLITKFSANVQFYLHYSTVCICKDDNCQTICFIAIDLIMFIMYIYCRSFSLVRLALL